MDKIGCYVAVGGPLLAGMFAAVQLMKAQCQASVLLPDHDTGPGACLVKSFLCLNVWLGFMVAVIANGKIATFDQFTNFGNSLFAAGLISGLTLAGVSLTIGAIGSVGLVCIRKQRKLFVGMVLLIIFAQAVGFYAFIISLTTISKAARAGYPYELNGEAMHGADATYGEAMQYAACTVVGMMGSLAGITQNGAAVIKLGVFLPLSVMKGMVTVVIAGMIGIFTLIAMMVPCGGYNNVGASFFICGVTMGFLGSKDLAILGKDERTYVNMVLKQFLVEVLGVVVLIYSLVTGKLITTNFDPSEGEQPLTQDPVWFSGRSAQVFGDEDGSTATWLLVVSSIVLVAITVTTATSVNSGDVVSDPERIGDRLLEAEAP